jgi:hypothetical protein
VNFKRWFSLGFLPDGEGGGSVVETKHDLSKMSGCIRAALDQGKAPGCLLFGGEEGPFNPSRGCAVGLAIIGAGMVKDYYLNCKAYDRMELGATLTPGRYCYYAAELFGMSPDVVFEAECRYMGWEYHSSVKQTPAEVADWLESKGF